MGLGTTRAVALVGLSGHVVEVQAHLAASVPGFVLVGLPDAALSESRDRVRAAVTSSGIPWPQRKVTINLSPAALPKSGTGFDLAIAVALLAGAQVVPARAVEDVVHLGSSASTAASSPCAASCPRWPRPSPPGSSTSSCRRPTPRRPGSCPARASWG